MRRTALVAIALALLTAAVFRPLGGYGFVELDDPRYVAENPFLAGGLTARGLVWAFTSTGYAFNWHPLTWLSHMLDVDLFGLAAGRHHLTSVAIHVLNVALLFLVLKAMTGALWRSAAVAALFGVHPLHVESVAWISERKDVLSALFWLAAMGLYVRYLRRPGARRYAAVAAVFGLGLAAKPMPVTLPLVLLLFDGWPLGRWRMVPGHGGGHPPLGRWGWPAGWGKSAAAPVLEKLPLLAMSAASGAVTYLAQARGGAVSSLERLPLGVRAGNALVSYARYLWKTIRPLDLSVFYPYPAGGWGPGPVSGSLLLLVVFTAVALLFTRRRPYLLAGWLWYLVTLVPVIGLVQVGTQAMADRYTYLPLVGIFMALAWGLGDALRARPALRAPVAVMALAVILALAATAGGQVRVWRDGLGLYRHALAATSGNWFVEYNLGESLDRRGMIREAMEHYKRALAFKPDLADPNNNLGNACLKLGLFDEAASHFRRAMLLDPSKSLFPYNLGVALARGGRPDEAEAMYRLAIGLDPAFAEAYNNLGVILLGRWRADEAWPCFTRALRYKPDYAEAHYNLGLVLEMQGKPGEATPHFREALRLDPDHQGARLGLARLQGGSRVP